MPMTEAELLAHSGAALAHYKIMRVVHLRPGAAPYALGKVHKTALRRQFGS